jgi:hypothetical protein
VRQKWLTDALKHFKDYNEKGKSPKLLFTLVDEKGILTSDYDESYDKVKKTNLGS